VWENCVVGEPPPSSGLSPRASLTIALAGILATLVAAIAASWLTGHQQSDQQDKSQAAQLAASDRAELRAVIDQANLALLRSVNAARDYYDGATAGSSREQRETHHAARRAVGRMLVALARLTVRLGEHRVTANYRRARDALVAQVSCITNARVRKREKFGEVRQLVNQAANAFQGEAARLVGSAVHGTFSGTTLHETLPENFNARLYHACAEARLP
jgi:hypothetical protein